MTAHRLRSVENHETTSQYNIVAPLENIRMRTIDILGVTIPLPNNKIEYYVVEVCAILAQIKKRKNKKVKVKLSKRNLLAPSARKVIVAISYHRNLSLSLSFLVVFHLCFVYSNSIKKI